MDEEVVKYFRSLSTKTGSTTKTKTCAGLTVDFLRSAPNPSDANLFLTRMSLWNSPSKPSKTPQPDPKSYNAHS